MTKTYTIRAWCVRPFTSSLELEAESPEHALFLARCEDAALQHAAEECIHDGYSWDEFAVCDEQGNELLHVLDEPAQIRNAGPAFKEALAWLATAAEDLDVAIDGATTEFDLERNELAAACRHARETLVTGQPLDVHRLLAARRQVAVIWSIEDVHSVRPDLTDDQAWDVLHECYRKHDCEWGFTWTYIEDMADILFGEKTLTEKE